MISDKTSISIFQQTGIGEQKIQGLHTYGKDITIAEITTLPTALPDFIEDPEDYFNSPIKGNLVLSFLKHPDLADHLVRICNTLSIPIVASGPRNIQGAYSPMTCCGLPNTTELGAYGTQFGVPEYTVTLSEDGGEITGLAVTHGASCGATWRVMSKLVGQTTEVALEIIAREMQYLCQADPSAFDPVSGHSPLHFAGDLHTGALLKGIEKAQS